VTRLKPNELKLAPFVKAFDLTTKVPDPALKNH
jgi:hypothetical protein